MPPLEYNEGLFRSRVDNALVEIRKVLHVNRSPELASLTFPHSYADKFALAEYLTKISLSAELNALELLGLTELKLKRLLEWKNNRSVTLRFHAEEKTVFNKEVSRKYDSSDESHLELHGFVGGIKKIISKTITTVIDYYWDYELNYEIFFFAGNNPQDKVVLQARTAKYQIVCTNVKDAPRPVSKVFDNKDFNITWLLQQISDNLHLTFKINREKPTCRTPRRNADTDLALKTFHSLSDWCEGLANFFLNDIFRIQQNHNLNLSTINLATVFNPIQPLFEVNVADKVGNNTNDSTDNETRTNANPEGKVAEKKKEEKEVKKQEIETKSNCLVALTSDSSNWPKEPILSISDVNAFLNQQKRSIREKLLDLTKVFPSAGASNAYLITFIECTILMTCRHIQSLTEAYNDSLNSIEDMLRKQLIAALGKEVTVQDFIGYMKYHQRKLYKAKYEPKQFAYAVRRAAHTPEGGIAIESSFGDGVIAEPIITTVKHIPNGAPMGFNINAATQVKFGGSRYLHAWLNHSFNNNDGQTLTLVARARQFCSFIVLLGRINGPTSFDPKYAMILENKDSLKIPLLLETIPTAKEFKKAVQSLSEEQERFAKAYRAMQLESTLFGIVVIQLKPQLEKLLNLQSDSLTKEIQLVRDLLELFITYQIPSDQLSYDPLTNPNANAAGKIEIVKRQVKTMQDMVKAMQKQEIKEKFMEAAYVNPNLESSEEESEQDDDEDEECEEEEREEEGALFIEEEQRSHYAQEREELESAQMDDSLLDLMSAPSAPLARRSSIKKEVKEKVMKKSKDKESSSPAVMSKKKESAPASKNASKSVVAKPAKAIKSNAETTKTNNVETKETKTEEIKEQEPVIVEEEEDIIQEQEAIDFTKIPATLDSAYESLDEDAAIRPTIINIGTNWTGSKQTALLAQPINVDYDEEKLKVERDRAFDLLDALSRSGSLLIDEASLHVVIARTHCFDKSLINTVVQDNVNPIEKLERSSLIQATTIQGKAAVQLIKSEHKQRVIQYSAPKLMAVVPEDNKAVVIAAQ